MPKIPMIELKPRQNVSADGAYNPTPELNATISKIKSINAKVDLIDKFQEGWEEQEDFSDQAKYKKSQQEMGFNLYNKFVEMQQSGEELYDVDGNSLVWTQLQEDLDNWKDNKLKNVISSRNLNKYKNEALVQSSMWEGQHKLDIKKRYIGNQAFTIGQDYIVNMTIGTEQSTKDAEIQYNQIKNMVGEETAKTFKSQAYLRMLDIEKNQALEVYNMSERKDSDWQKYLNDIKNISDKYDNDPKSPLNADDSFKNKQNALKMIQGVEEQYVDQMNKSWDIVTKAIEQNKAIPMSQIAPMLRVWPEEIQDIFYSRLETTADSLTTGKFEDFINNYKILKDPLMVKEHNKSYEDMIGYINKAESPALRDAGILLLGELMTDVANQTGKTAAVVDKDLGILGFGAESDLTMSWVDQEFFDNMQSLLNLSPADTRGEVYKKKIEDYYKWRKKKNIASLTKEEWKEFETTLFGGDIDAALRTSTLFSPIDFIYRNIPAKPDANFFKAYEGTE